LSVLGRRPLRDAPHWRTLYIARRCPVLEFAPFRVRILSISRRLPMRNVVLCRTLSSARHRALVIVGRSHCWTLSTSGHVTAGHCIPFHWHILHKWVSMQFRIRVSAFFPVLTALEGWRRYVAADRRDQPYRDAVPYL
jgi:hypothetical protein